MGARFALESNSYSSEEFIKWIAISRCYLQIREKKGYFWNGLRNRVWRARIVLKTSEMDSWGNFDGKLYFDFFLDFFFSAKKNNFEKWKFEILEIFWKSQKFFKIWKFFNGKSKILVLKFSILKKSKNIFFPTFQNYVFSMKKKSWEKKSKYSSPTKFPQESISDVFRTIWALLPRFWIELLFFPDLSRNLGHSFPPKEILWGGRCIHFYGHLHTTFFVMIIWCM